jgi:tetratricopeptide (TPR) repeat protein
MPLPTDRAELLRQAAEGERALREIPSAGNPKVAGRRAATQFQLARIRDRLGESREAERLFGEAATGFWELGSPSDRDFAAGARISQARIAMAAGRDKEALAILDRMVEQFGGFPTLENVPISPAGALSVWLLLLERADDQKRLYDAAGVALEMLDPHGSARDHGAFGKALAWRARSADELGYTDEAVELYQKAITWLEQEEPNSDVDALLDHAVQRVAPLLDDLGRDEEAAAAYKRIIERFKAKKTFRSRAVVATARTYLRLKGS